MLLENIKGLEISDQNSGSLISRAGSMSTVSRALRHRTNLEKQLIRIVKELGVKFTPFFPTRSGFEIDVAVFRNKKRYGLEADGTKWHSTDHQKKHDRFRDYLLRKAGWLMLRCKEEEFDDPKKLKDKISVFLEL